MNYFSRFYEWFRVYVLAVPWRLIVFVLVIFLAVLPILQPGPYILRLLTTACIFGVFAASWDFLSGFVGQVSLGHALFFGISAYTSSFLNIHLDLPPWLTIPIAATVSMILGTLLCLPALRLRGIYLTLFTLALPLILSGIVHGLPDYTGGDMGLSGISPMFPTEFLNCYLVFLSMIVSVFIMWKLTDTKSKIVRTGIIFRAIREDEITARSSGIYTTKYKIFAFAISGLFCAIAGGLYAHYLRVVGPSVFALSFSFNAVIWTVFGGVGTIYGSLVGVFILFPFTELLCLNPVGQQIRFLLQAVLMIVIILFMPQGITIWIRDKLERECPRCKTLNTTIRSSCRICLAPLR